MLRGWIQWLLQVKYVGDEREKEGQQKNQMDKTLLVGGARISYSIWEVGGTYLHRIEITLTTHILIHDCNGVYNIKQVINRLSWKLI